jgi:hypothetical protein
VRDFAKLGLHFLVAAVVSFKAGGNPTPRMGSHLAGELSPHATSRKEVHHKKKTIFFRGREIRSSKPRAAEYWKRQRLLHFLSFMLLLIDRARCDAYLPRDIPRRTT